MSAPRRHTEVGAHAAHSVATFHTTGAGQGRKLAAMTAPRAAQSAPGPAALPPDEDLALIRRVAAKDREAFAQLYQRYYPRLLGYVGNLLGRRELAEEVVHEVMLVVWQDAARFRQTARLSTWLFGIAYYQALKARAKTAEPPGDRAPMAPPALDDADPADALIRQETRTALGHALDALSPAQRAVVELAFYHDYSYRDIAALVGCPVNTVKTRMLYARKHLAQLLPAAGTTTPGRHLGRVA